jgi:hypothetical protein
MAEVGGRQERPVFTWNPVEQMWIQERGVETKAPPTPNDIHAIQTWFLDTDANEWIQTVLGPMGRQLAEQWRGAHRVPDSAIVRKLAAPKRRNPLPFAVAGVVLLALIGGVAVGAPSLLTPSPDASTAPKPPQQSVAVSGAPNPDGSAAPAPSPAASAGPSADPTTGPVTTVRPATPRPTAPPTPRPATPPPDFVSPSVATAGTTFHFTFVGLPPASTYRTTYTRGSVTTGYANGEVPPNGQVQIDLRTSTSFAPDIYFFTIRAADVVKTVSFRISS